MADGSVGKISLDIDITGDISKQISAISEKIGAGLKASVESSTKGMFKDVEKSTDKSMKKVKSTITGQLRKIKSEASAVMKSFSSVFKKIKLPKDFGIPEDVEMPQTSGTPTTQTRGPPKINAGVDFEKVKAQIDNLSRTLDTTNAQIQHHQNRLADLKKSYESAFNPDTKNKIQEEIFKTETKLNTLIKKSDQAGFKLADLDNKLQGTSSSAKTMNATLNNTVDKLEKTAASATKASGTTSGLGKTFDKTNATIKNTASNLSRSAKASANVSKKSSGLGKVADNVGSRFGIMGKTIRSALKRVLIMATLYKAIRGFVSYMNSALATNKQFSNSLAQVKTNLQVAFMPIYQAILPALNTLMSALAKVTTYIASFISALFGKTYKESFKAAKGLNKAKAAIKGVGGQAKKTAKELKVLAGFDELNVLDFSQPEESPDIGGGADIPAMVAPPVDTSQIDKSMQGLIDKAKELGKVIKDNFSEGFKIGLDGANLDGTKKHLEGIKKSIKGIFTDPDVKDAFSNWATRQLKSFGTIVGSFANIGISIAEFLTGSVDKYLEKNSPFIKEKIISIFDISGDIGEIKANFSMALANVFSVFKSDQAKEIGSDIIEIFSNSFLSLVELGLMFTRDFTSMVTQPFIDNQEEIKLALENTMLFIGPIIEGVKLLFENAFESINNAYEEYIAPAMENFSEGFSKVFGALLDMYNEHLAPVLEELGVKIKELLDGPVSDAVDSFMQFVGKVVHGVSEIWNQTLAPLISWLIKTFGPAFSKVFGVIGDVFITVFGTIFDVVGNIFKALGGLMDFIVGVFTGDWKKAWGGIKDFFKGIWDALVGIVKAPINLIIGLINGLIRAAVGGVNGVVGLINKLSFDVPDWVPGIGGKKFGFSIPEVTAPQIPYLAKGGIIEQPTLAMVGEQGKEAVVPLENNTEWMYMLASIIAQALSGAISKEGNNETSSRNSGDIILKVGETEFGRVAIKAINSETRRTGKVQIVT